MSLDLRYTLLLMAPPVALPGEEQVVETCSQLLWICHEHQAKIAVGQGTQRLPALGRSQFRIVFIAGRVTPDSLISVVHTVHDRGMKPIVVVDALQTDNQFSESLKSALVQLTLEGIQLAHAGEVPSLLGMRWNDFNMYRFAKADITASIAIIVGGKIVAIKRKNNPDKGKWALPGGFLVCQLETVEECGAREAMEETHVLVEPEDLILIDVRSSPRRDNRQHVVDHGYLWVVPPDMESTVIARLEADDDAEGLELVSIDWLLSQDIAFDHRLIIEQALKMI